MLVDWTKCEVCGMCCSIRHPRNCIFLNKETLKCRIYPIRPIRCRSFKFDCEVCKMIRKKRTKDKEKVCVNCGAKVIENANYCYICGKNVRGFYMMSK